MAPPPEWGGAVNYHYHYSQTTERGNLKLEFVSPRVGPTAPQLSKTEKYKEKTENASWKSWFFLLT